MVWTFILVTYARDCFDVPDWAGGTIPVRAIQDAPVATPAAEFCTVEAATAFV